MKEEIIRNLISTYPQFTFKENENVAKYTTVKIGGLARLFVVIPSIFEETTYSFLKDAQSFQEIEGIINNTDIPFQSFIKELLKNNIKFHILGAGSDTLFSDEPFDGIVIKLGMRNNFEIPGTSAFSPADGSINSRHAKYEQEERTDLDFNKAYFTEKKDHPTSYFAEAGCMLSYLIPITLKQNLSGLQWFSHIPASIGGAVYNNIHGGRIMFSQYVQYVLLLNKNGDIKLVLNNEMGFDYDNSRIQQKSEIVLAVILTLYKEDETSIKESKDFVDNWVLQKIAIQPKDYSVGSTFKNISEEVRIAHNLPTNSAGYLIDQCGLNGYRIGDAQIYEKHGNFFLNLGNATSKDYSDLINFAIEKVNEKFGITLEPEVKIVK